METHGDLEIPHFKKPSADWGTRETWQVGHSFLRRQVHDQQPRRLRQRPLVARAHRRLVSVHVRRRRRPRCLHTYTFWFDCRYRVRRQVAYRENRVRHRAPRHLLQPNLLHGWQGVFPRGNGATGRRRAVRHKRRQRVRLRVQQGKRRHRRLRTLLCKWWFEWENPVLVGGLEPWNFE